MKFKTMIATAAALTLATAAQAQVGPSVGATVYGPEGEVVGTIDSMEDGIVVINTGSYTVPMGENSFGEGEQGPKVSVTKAQLDNYAQKQEAEMAAALNAALVADAALYSADGFEVGTVTSVDADTAMVMIDENPATFGRDQFAVDKDGLLVVVFEKEQLLAVLNGDAGATTESDDAE
tara:strand:- start:1209 stop:1742 length:534 start_codon:yes stop_codon:yes gene_type:complete